MAKMTNKQLVTIIVFLLLVMPSYAYTLGTQTFPDKSSTSGSLPKASFWQWVKEHLSPLFSASEKPKMADTADTHIIEPKLASNKQSVEVITSASMKKTLPAVVEQKDGSVKVNSKNDVKTPKSAALESIDSPQSGSIAKTVKAQAREADGETLKDNKKEIAKVKELVKESETIVQKIDNGLARKQKNSPALPSIVQ